MFLLITGASGVGKTSVRRLLAGEFARVLDAAELSGFGDAPQQAVERAVRLALGTQPKRHFLLFGDALAPSDVLAAPSAAELRGLGVCLLDASEDAHRRRLFLRGDEADAMVQHVASAARLRAQVPVPAKGRAPWTAHVIDTSELRDYEVASRVAAWIRRVIGASARLRLAARAR